MKKEEAYISLDNIGLLRGYGVFDYLKTHQHKPFLLKEHLTRFANSAKKLDLKIPLSNTEIEKVLQKLISKNGQTEVAFRLVLTGGQTKNGIEFNVEKPTFFILTEAYQHLPEKMFQTGIKLITFAHQRNLPRAKSTNYITAVKLQKEKKKYQAFDILYTWQDKVLETTIANFFLIQGNRLITAKEDILLGTTRNFVLKFASKLKNFKIEEREVKLEELKTADEAFVTATNKDVLPVTQIDQLTIGNGRIGKQTKLLMKEFQKEMNKAQERQ